MPQVNDIEETIVRYICGELLRTQDTSVEVEANLFTSGLVDSVGIMRLIAHLEKTLDYKIPPADLVPENFRTVRVMADYLARQLAS